MSGKASLSHACPRPRGSLYNERTVYQAGCGRWACEPCARRKASRLARRFRKIPWQRAPSMVTLTAANADDADPTPAAMRRFARRLRSFRRAVLRFRGPYQWAWVREIAPRSDSCICLESIACRCGAGGGRLHIHMLWDARFIPQAWLSKTAKQCGLGRIIDVRRVSDERAARYVSKYLTKMGAHPAFRRSRRFAIRANEPAKEKSVWAWDPRRPALVAVECLGCREIDFDAEGWSAYDPASAGKSRSAGFD